MEKKGPGQPPKEDKRNNRITIRLNDKEHAAIMDVFERQKAGGYSMLSRYLRDMLLEKSGQVSRNISKRRSGKDYIYYQKYAFQLRKLGHNLNTLLRFIQADKGISKLSNKDIYKLKDISNELDNVLSELK